MNKPLWAIKHKLIYGIYPIAGAGGSKTEMVSAPTTPAPSASESAEDIYQARVKYDPLLARQEYDIQMEYAPKQAALYNALYGQYYPEMARQQQRLQRELYPQQSQIMEAGATSALEQLQNPENALLQALVQQAQAGLTPAGITPEQQAAQEAIRGRESERLSRGLRERSNLGGTLYSGKGRELESQGLQELSQRYAAEYIDRLAIQRQHALATASGISGLQMQTRQLSQAAVNPYLQILYPQVGTQQPNIQPYQFQSAVPSADTLYNAYFQASQPNYGIIPGQQSPLWGIAGQAAGAAGAKLMFMCISEDTLIDTQTGQKLIQNIRAGDIVYDKNNKLVKVLWKYEFDEMPTKNRFIELDFKGKKLIICDLHKINGVKAIDLDVPKKFVEMNKRSYDFLTTGCDGSYRSNEIGIDSMIPELHSMIKVLQEA